MTQIEKLEKILLLEPTEFRFEDFSRIMQAYGFQLDQKGKTSGSRIRFYRESDGRMFIMHVPHPKSTMSPAAVRAAARFIRGEKKAK